jgi:hypothetical protein
MALSSVAVIGNSLRLRQDDRHRECFRGARSVGSGYRPRLPQRLAYLPCWAMIAAIVVYLVWVAVQ